MILVFPLLDLITCKYPVAFIITPTGSFELFPIKKMISRFFYNDYGVFLIEPKKFIPIKNGGGKSRIALYDARAGKALSWEALKGLDEFRKKNKVNRITSLLLKKAKEGNVAMNAKVAGQSELLDNLLKENSIVPIEPLEVDAEIFLTEFKNYDPDKFGTYAQTAVRLAKNYAKLKTLPMKPTFQIGAIVGAVVLLIIVLMATPSIITMFSKMDTSGLTNNMGGIFALFHQPTTPPH